MMRALPAPIRYFSGKGRFWFCANCTARMDDCSASLSKPNSDCASASMENASAKSGSSLVASCRCFNASRFLPARISTDPSLYSRNASTDFEFGLNDWAFNSSTTSGESERFLRTESARLSTAEGRSLSSACALTGTRSFGRRCSRRAWPLPRWALSCYFRKDGTSIWANRSVSGSTVVSGPT